MVSKPIRDGDPPPRHRGADTEAGDGVRGGRRNRWHFSCNLEAEQKSAGCRLDKPSGQREQHVQRL